MFEVLEARLNVTVMVKFANATALIPGIADPVPVIFDVEYKAGRVGVVGMGASAPQMTMASSLVPEGFVGMAISVNGAGWSVADRQHDSDLPTGLTTVFLEKV